LWFRTKARSQADSIRFIDSSERGTAGEKGLGLGFKLCQGLLDKIGGKIEIETSDECRPAIKIFIPNGVEA
jgi:K+-sensing histidine kinase KdpD